MTEGIGWVSCGYCFAISLGAPPHGQGQPCPVKMLTEVAYVKVMEAQEANYVAQEASYARSGFAMNDMAAFMRKMSGADEDE